MIFENLRGLTKPPSNQHAFLDGLRALSLFLMITFHVVFFLPYFVGRQAYLEIVSQISIRPFVHGQFGCDIFFVLTGFLLAYFMIPEFKAKSQIDLKRFVIRRSLRILPLYLLALALMMLALPMGVDSVKRINVSTIWANILQINNFLSWPDQYMEHSWFIALTVQFSLIVPLILIFLYKIPQKWRIHFLSTLLASAFFIKWLVLHLYGQELIATMGRHTYLFHEVINERSFTLFWDLIYDKPHTRYGSVIVGIIVAYLFHETKTKEILSQSKTLRMFCVGLFFLFATFTLFAPEFFTDNNPPGPGLKIFYLTTYRYSYSIAFGLLILLGFAKGTPGLIINKVLGARFFYPIAQLSYAGYLFHPSVIFLLFYFGFNKGWLPIAGLIDNAPGLFLISLIVFVVTLLVSLPAYVYWEMPFSKLRPPRTRLT